MKEFIKKYKHYFITLLIAIVLIVIDQITKVAIVNNIEMHENKEIIANFFYLTYSLNYGAMNGSAQGMRLLLILVTFVALGFLFYLCKNSDFKERKLYSLGIAFVFGGAIGNFIDRLFNGGGVVDFLSFYPLTKGHDWFLKGLISLNPWPTFNMADTFIVIGVIMFAVYLLFFDKKKEEENGNN